MMAMAAASARSSAADTRKPLAAFVADAATEAHVRRVTAALGWADADVLSATPAEAVKRLASSATPARLLVDLSGSADPLADLELIADVCDGETPLIAIGTVNDVDLYRKLLAAGVDDYLVKPLASEALAAALTALGAAAAETEDTAPRDPLGRLVAVIGARGGVGSTTVAVNTAWLLAHDLKLKTALVDLDLYFGTCALALDVEPGRGFRLALESPGRIDNLFLERVMVRISDLFYLLAAENDLEFYHTVDRDTLREALHVLVQTIRRNFKMTVFDLPRHAARTQVSLLTPPASLVLVSDPSLAGLRDTIRLAKMLQHLAPEAELSVVLERCGAIKGAELAEKEFEQDGSIKIGSVIPFEAKPAVASTAAGKPLVCVAPRSRTARALKQLAVKLSGTEESTAKPSPLGRLLHWGT
ncbi:MAG: pilus assembly protein CpaE [Rhodospirillales bacterium]|nr:MAG: pilus assembly protein CpaE [Rhodospirillales bacterium]